MLHKLKLLFSGSTSENNATNMEGCPSSADGDTGAMLATLAPSTTSGTGTAPPSSAERSPINLTNVPRSTSGANSVTSNVSNPSREVADSNPISVDAPAGSTMGDHTSAPSALVASSTRAAHSPSSPVEEHSSSHPSQRSLTSTSEDEWLTYALDGNCHMRPTTHVMMDLPPSTSLVSVASTQHPHGASPVGSINTRKMSECPSLENTDRISPPGLATFSGGGRNTTLGSLSPDGVHGAASLGNSTNPSQLDHRRATLAASLHLPSGHHHAKREQLEASFRTIGTVPMLLSNYGSQSIFTDPLAATRVMQVNRQTMIEELERRKNKLKKHLAEIQTESAAQNIFALVRASSASKLQYVLQEQLCNVNERDYNGCTPLHVAASEGNTTIVRVLVSFDADVLAVDRNGRTPLDCAAANRHGEVSRFLLAAIRRQQVGGGGGMGSVSMLHSMELSMPSPPPSTAMATKRHGDADDHAAVQDLTPGERPHSTVSPRRSPVSATAMVFPPGKANNTDTAHGGGAVGETPMEDVASPPTLDERHSCYTTISDTVPLIVCMCGLPGRGKSFISKRLVRYMNWKGVPCRVFNAGAYRRQLLGVAGTSGADFFDPNNPKGKELREKMAELACEDLVRFIASHEQAIGILDATNTTKTRRRWLKSYFESETAKHNLSFRLLFIESVCTDENIITENILRSKCDNDDFKSVTDTNAVIAEFRDRIHQYEKVYEPLDPTELLSFIKIINVKHHVVLHKVSQGLGSRIAFFLMNLHPVAYPIYIALPGETVGDSQHQFGGDERLTAKGEEYALALKHFIQDRYVANMVVLHATNRHVISTLMPLIDEECEGAYATSSMGPHTPSTEMGTASGEATAPQSTTDSARVGRNTFPNPSTRRMLSPLRHNIPIEITRVPATHPSSGTRRPTTSTVAAKSPDVVSEGSEAASPSNRAASLTFPTGQDGGMGSRRNTDLSPTDDEEEEAEEVVDEVLCPVPGLDNINFGRFGGHTMDWSKERYPKLYDLLLATTGIQQQEEEVPSPTSRDGGALCSTRTSRFGKLGDALTLFQHAPQGTDPELFYSVQFPNGESCRQVNVRLEPAIMAVMRARSPAVVVAPPIPAQAMLAFFTDLKPEMSPALRVPKNCVVELGVKDDIIIHQLLPNTTTTTNSNNNNTS